MVDCVLTNIPVVISRCPNLTNSMCAVDTVGRDTGSALEGFRGY